MELVYTKQLAIVQPFITISRSVADTCLHDVTKLFSRMHCYDRLQVGKVAFKAQPTIKRMQDSKTAYKMPCIFVVNAHHFYKMKDQGDSRTDT